MELPEFITDNMNIVLIIVGAIISLMVIKLATKILFRLIILTVVLIGLFLAYQQFSGTNIIDDTQSLYCSNTQTDLTKCNCFVKPIIQDLETRFSPEGLKKLKSKKLLANTEFIKSYKRKESEIQNCFESVGDSKGILDEILNDIKRNGLKILQ